MSNFLAGFAIGIIVGVLATLYVSNS